MSYEKDGIKFPRCTEIISDATNKSGGLIQWSANQAVEWLEINCDPIPLDYMGNEVGLIATGADLEQARFAYKDTSQTALDVGSEVHAWIEKYLKDKNYPDIEYKFYYDNKTEVHNAITAFLNWAAEVDLKPLALEETVWADRWAGTLDFFGYYKGKLYVIDWKTSKKFYPEMRYQVAAYRSAQEEENVNNYLNGIPVHGNVEGCGVLMLDKETGMPTFKDTSKTYEKDIEVFNKMVELYYLRHPRIRKRFEKEKILTIDRKNNKKDYSPDNCQWISLSRNAGKDKPLFSDSEKIEIYRQKNNEDNATGNGKLGWCFKDYHSKSRKNSKGEQ